MFDAKKVASWGTMRLIPNLLERGYLRNGYNPVREAEVLIFDKRMVWIGGSFLAVALIALIAWCNFPHESPTGLLLSTLIGVGMGGGACSVLSSIDCCGFETNALPEFCRALSDLERLLLPQSIQELFESYPSDEKLREIGMEILVKALSVQHTDAFGEAAALQEFRNRHAVLSRLSMVPENLNECLRVARKRVGKQQAVA